MALSTLTAEQRADAVEMAREARKQLLDQVKAGHELPRVLWRPWAAPGRFSQRPHPTPPGKVDVVANYTAFHRIIHTLARSRGRALTSADPRRW